MTPSAGKILGFLALAAVVLAAASTESLAVHKVAGKVPCLDCHSSLPLNDNRPSFREEVGPICVGCHRDYHGKAGTLSHPVNVPPSMAVPRDMILDAKGRIICITCHKFHTGYKDSDGKKAFFLRRSPGKAFCYSCHKKRLF
jgi:predicted CXXCH cytochrome family protein